MVALERWPRDGVPDNPGAWIITDRPQRAIDRIRRERALRGQAARARGAPAASSVDDEAGDDDESIPTTGCALFFTCCHPALAPEARVALTLRTARRAVDTRGRARLPRPRERRCSSASSAPSARSATPASPTRCPTTTSCPTGCARVLAALYLIFTEGYLATSADTLRPPRAVRRGDPAGPGAGRADARRARGGGPARADAAAPLPPRRPRRTPTASWCCSRTRTARSGTRARSRRGWCSRPRRAPPVATAGPYALQAAIAAEHARAPAPGDTDWPQVAALYDVLVAVAPVAGGGAQPGGGGGHGRGAGGRHWR